MATQFDTTYGIKCNGENIAGQIVQGNQVYSLSFRVINENVGDQYWLFMKSGNDDWKSITISEGLPYPSGGGTGGTKTYTVNWRVPPLLNSSCTIKITKVTGGELVSGTFAVHWYTEFQSEPIYINGIAGSTVNGKTFSGDITISFYLTHESGDHFDGYLNTHGEEFTVYYEDMNEGIWRKCTLKDVSNPIIGLGGTFSPRGYSVVWRSSLDVSSDIGNCRIKIWLKTYNWGAMTSNFHLLDSPLPPSEEEEGNYFEIYSSAPQSYVRILSPNGNEKIIKQSNYNITWESSSNVHHFALMYSNNGGVNWNNINSNVNGSLRQYSWTTPDVISSICLIKIIAYDPDGNILSEDISDYFFSIYNSLYQINLVYPNGGEKFYYGNIENITFTNIGNYQCYKYKLLYSVDNGRTWNEIVTTQSYLYSWQVPVLTQETNKGIVRVLGLSSNNTTLADDICNNYISILPFIINIVSPKENSILNPKTKTYIKWVKVENKTFKCFSIYLSTNGKDFTKIFDYINPNLNKIPWKVYDTETNNAVLSVQAMTDTNKVMGRGIVNFKIRKLTILKDTAKHIYTKVQNIRKIFIK